MNGMSLDRALSFAYTAMKDYPKTEHAIEMAMAMKVLEDAAEALDKSQRILQLVMQEEFDKELHGMNLYVSVLNNAKVLGGNIGSS